MNRSLIASLALAMLVPPLVADAPRAPKSAERPGIRLWTSSGDVYHRGERVRVYFRTERDAFVTVLRVDTDGRVRVIYPQFHYEDNLVRGGRNYWVGNYGRDAFLVDDDPGIGYLFAVASEDPFIYDAIIDRDRWDMRHVAGGRIHGDPYVELEHLVRDLLPSGYGEYDTHLLPYYVGRRYDYPRFVCYDCHSYVSYARWNPYRHYCRSFTLFVYTDPYYYYPSYWYPTRYYGGTRVVYVRPSPQTARYVFKQREASSPGIEYRDRRFTGSEAERRPADRGVRAADLGGVGSVPVPGETGRRYAPSPGATVPDRSIPQVDDGRRRAPTGPERAAPSAEPREDERRRPASAATPERRAPESRPSGTLERRPPDRAPESRRPDSPAVPSRPSAPERRAEPRRESPPQRAPEPRRAEPRERRPDPAPSARPSAPERRAPQGEGRRRPD